MPRPDAVVDDVANELNTWPGVRIERRQDGAAFRRLAVGHRAAGVGSARPLPFRRRAAAVIGGGVSRFDCVRDALLRVGHAGLPHGPAVGAQYPGWARAAGVSASPTASTSSVIS